MHIKLVIFAVAALAWPIEMAPSEEFEKELMLLKMKIENMEKSDHSLKIKIEKMESKIEKMESNEENMNENMTKMRNKIFDMENNDCGIEKKLTNSKTKKQNMNKDEELKSSKKGPLNNPDKMKNRENQNVLGAKVSHQEYDNDCCDILTERVNDINATLSHINERLNENTRKIVENQLEVQNNKKEIVTNTNNIDINANNINANDKEISDNSNSLVDLVKRSDYCAYRWGWNDGTPENQVITYERLLLDNNHNIPGAQMDINTGEFTAGLSAIYQIDVSIRMVVGALHTTSVFLRRNGVNLIESIIYQYSMNYGHDDVGGRYIIMKLDAGDTVSVYAEELAGNLYDITFCINVLK